MSRARSLPLHTVGPLRDCLYIYVDLKFDFSKGQKDHWKIGSPTLMLLKEALSALSSLDIYLIRLGFIPLCGSYGKNDGFDAKA